MVRLGLVWPGLPQLSLVRLGLGWLGQVRLPAARRRWAFLVEVPTFRPALRVQRW